MAKKSLIRLIIALVVIGVIALIVRLGGGGDVKTIDNETAPQDVLSAFPVKQVAEIQIKNAEGELNLSRAGEGGTGPWIVQERGEFPADSESITNFLLAIWDLKVTETVKVGDSQMNRLELIAPEKGNPSNSATVVSFRDAASKELRTLWMGKMYERKSDTPSQFGGGMTSTPVGRYVKTGPESPVYLVNNPFREISTDPAEWLSADFFQIDGIQSITIDTGTPEENWKLERGDAADDFTLAAAKEGESLDSGKVTTMKTALSSPRFEDVVPGVEMAVKTKFTITTFDGFTYNIAVNEKNDLNEFLLKYDVSAELDEDRIPGDEESDEEKEKLDAQYAAEVAVLKQKLEREQRLAGMVYKVRSYLIDGINKKRSEILEEKIEAPGLNPEEFVPIPKPSERPQAPAPSRPAGDLKPSLSEDPIGDTPAPKKAAAKPKAQPKGKGKAKAQPKAKGTPEPKTKAPKTPESLEEPTPPGDQ